MLDADGTITYVDDDGDVACGADEVCRAYRAYRARRIRRVGPGVRRQHRDFDDE